MDFKTLSLITESLITQMKPEANDDIVISEGLVDDIVDDARAALVPSLYRSGVSFDGWHQELSVEASPVHGVLIDGYNYLYNYPIFTINLPGKLMTGMGWMDILYLGSHGLGPNNYTRVSVKEFLEYRHHRFGSGTPCYTIIGDKIYLQNVGTHRYFNLHACFEKPSCVPGFDREHTIYPLPENLMTKLEIIVFRHLAPKIGLPVDIISDNMDSSRMGSMRDALKQNEQENREL